MHGQAQDAPCNWLNQRLATTLCAQIRRCKLALCASNLPTYCRSLPPVSGSRHAVLNLLWAMTARQRRTFFPACPGKCLVSNKSSLCKSCEEFKHSKSFAARARLLQIQIGADCLCRRCTLATKAHRFRLVRLWMWSEITSPICTGGFGRTASLQDACLASWTARLAPSSLSDLKIFSKQQLTFLKR